MSNTERNSVICLLGLLALDVICVFALIFTHHPEPTIKPSRLDTIIYDKTVEEGESYISQASDTVAAIPEPEPVVEEYTAPAPVTETYSQPEPVAQPTSNGGNFKSDGVWYDDSYRYTWYSSNTAYHYSTPEWTAGSDGIYRDSDGFVVVASSDLPQGSVVEDTPFGAAKVYDSGCASGTLDVYTNF